jgi:hypothetical protein
MTTHASRARLGPWRRGNVSSVVSLNGLGLALVVSGWYVAGGQLLLRDQVTGANVAIAGIIVAGAGNAVWLLTGRRALGLRREGIGALAQTRHLPRPQPGRRQPVASDEMTRYHRADCAFATGRAVVARSRKAHAASGRQPCGVCRP